MNSFSIFDGNEELMLTISELQKSLNLTQSAWPDEHFSLYKLLRSKIKQLKQTASVLFDNFFVSFNQERQRSEVLIKKLNFYRMKLRKCFGLQQELSNQEKKTKQKNKSLSSSIKKVKKFMKSEVRDLEDSLKKQQKIRKRLTFQCDFNLEQAENEFIEVFAEPNNQNEDSIDESKGYDIMMLDLSSYKQDYSRISMEKNIGGWESEFESSADEQEIGKYTIRNDLFKESHCLNKVDKGFDDSEVLEKVELLRQLIGIQAKRNSVEDLVPVGSVIVRESGMCQTMVSLGQESLVDSSEEVSR